jgi:hemolysin expression modulating protein
MKSAEDWLHTVSRRFMNEDSLDTYVDSKRDVLPATEFMRLLTAAEHRRVEIRTGKLFDKIPKGLFR